MAAFSCRRMATTRIWAFRSGTRTGYPTACGHGTIALGAWAIHTHPGSFGVTEVRIDVPSGRVTARVHTDGE
jgi:Proline racemase